MDKKNNKKAKKIKLPEDSVVTTEMVEALNTLFDYSSPGDLRRALTSVIFEFVLGQKDQRLDFPSLVDHVHAMIEFLDRCEQAQKE